MATTTPNFGWPVPTSSDLVKNGATAIEGLGDAIDASLLDLKGGTSGQVLAKASATDMDFSWVTDATGIPATIIDAKGDLIAGTAADTAARLAVGTNGQTLVADSSTATGLAWSTPSAGGGMTLISTTTLSGASTTISVAANSYKQLQLVIRGLDCSADNDVFLQINGITTSIYVPANIGSNNGSAYTYYTKTNGVYFNLPGYDGLGTGNKNNGTIMFYDCNSTNGKVINCNFYSETTTAGRLNIVNGTVGVTDTAVISSIVIKVASGSFDAGSALLYGVS